MLRGATYRWAAGLTLAVLLMLMPGVAAAAGWLKAGAVNQSTDVNPSVAMDGVGNTIAAWENSGASPTTVPGAHHTVGIPFFQALPDFSAGLSRDSLSPFVVLNRAGNGLAVWVHTTLVPTAQEIEIASIKSNGTVSAPVAIATGGTDAGISAAINENGDAVVAWLMGGNTVQVSTRHGLAGTFAAEFDLTAGADGAPSAAIDGSGNAIVAWPRNNGVHNEIDDLKHAGGAANTAWTAAGAAITAAGADLTGPVLATNPNGQIVAAFLNSSGPSVGAVSGTVSGGWGTTPTVATLSADLVTHGPVVTMLDNGGAAVGWSTATAVQVSLRPPPPAAFPTPAQVKSIPTSTPDSMTLAGNGNGELIAAWYGFNTTSMTNVVNASVKPAGSPSFGASQMISNSAVFSAAPVLSLDQAGDAVAAFPVTSSPLGISAAFYDNTPPHVGPITGPTTGKTGTSVSFSIPQPTDGFSAVASISWSFGDGGAAASAANVSHTFSSPGTFTVTVTATDAAGNAASTNAQITVSKTVTPPPATKCRVPKLKGKTLSQATTLLRKANCRLGKVTKPKPRKHHRLRPLIVSRSNPGAGSVRAAGTKVALTLVEKPKPKPKPKRH
ncbi:MAG TPA: PKD domain-containing protein [Solirubrobacteraceae bacterium]|nr:PKD domain-containing protein [Solirubrobacteraceae bacterium]